MGDWSGEVYVYEGSGELYRGTTTVRFDGVQEPVRGKRKVPPKVLEPSVLNCEDLKETEKPKEKTANIVANGARPKKLFQIALSFVASHVDLVESLIEFPEDVGRQLFEEARRFGKFRLPEDSVEAFRLFADAYGCRFVSVCDLRHSLISAGVVDVVADACRTSLQEVRLRDVEFESPGIRRSLLLGVGRMTSLVKLALVGCDLKDEDLRMITSRFRMCGGESLARLSELDLSGNYNLSGLCVRYLVGFTKLTLLNMTGTSVQSNSGIDRLLSMGLHIASTDHVSRLFEIQKGAFGTGLPMKHSLTWADEVFLEWQKTLTTSPMKGDERTQNKKEFKFSSFYNPTKERAKEARVRNAFTAALVFVRRGPAEDNRLRSAPIKGGNSKRKRLALDSALEEIFGENSEDSSRITFDATRLDNDLDDLAAQYHQDGRENRRIEEPNHKRCKTRWFDNLR